MRAITCAAWCARRASWPTARGTPIPRVEIVKVDLEDEAALTEQLAGCDAAFYLVHSMQSAGSDIRRADRDGRARSRTPPPRPASARLIYLGGLGDAGEQPERASAIAARGRARSRGGPGAGHRVPGGDDHRRRVRRRSRSCATWPNACRSCITPTLGAHRVPADRGGQRPALPRAVPRRSPRRRDARSRSAAPTSSPTKQLLQMMAEERGLRRRLIIPVPVLTPVLSSLWIHLVTPVQRADGASAGRGTAQPRRRRRTTARGG